MTCERVVERFNALVRAQTVLCLIARDGRLVLGAKSDSGYAGFLRIGDPCDGDSILDWVEQTGRAAIIGPTGVSMGPDSEVVSTYRAIREDFDLAVRSWAAATVFGRCAFRCFSKGDVSCAQRL